MRILSLNCQHGYQEGLESFLKQKLESDVYDFFLLQEVDEKVSNYLKHVSYKLLRVFNTESDAESQVCIVYRANFELLNKEFQSFARMRMDPWFGFKGPVGFLYAEFSVEGEHLRVGSIHLHSGIDQQIRLEEMDKVQKSLSKESKIPTLVAGDLNAGFPGEAKRLANKLTSEFAYITEHIQPTLDSRYSENVPHFPNRVAALLRIIGIAIKLRTDHAFLDLHSANQTSAVFRVLTDRVSDHSPVEVIW